MPFGVFMRAVKRIIQSDFADNTVRRWPTPGENLPLSFRADIATQCFHEIMACLWSAVFVTALDPAADDRRPGKHLFRFKATHRDSEASSLQENLG
jgi:hypothetical protein